MIDGQLLASIIRKIDNKVVWTGREIDNQGNRKFYISDGEDYEGHVEITEEEYKEWRRIVSH